MTTKAVAAGYLRDHLLQHAGKPSVVFNPKGLLLESLPAIYCFNNGGPPDFLLALAISADGVILGDHVLLPRRLHAARPGGYRGFASR